MSTHAPVRVGVIGAGHFAARVHIPNLAARDDVVLESVCRLGAAELETVRAAFGFRHASEDWRDVLDRALDAVVIASPHDLHYAQTRAALERGCHVMVEKPMCLDPREAWDLVAIARRVGREIVVANGWHYRPGLEQARALAGELGEIEHVLCHMASPTRSVFDGSGGRVLWHDAMFQPDRTTWQNPTRGGGYAYGQLSHALALLFWISGLRARSARAAARRGATGIDLHDAAILTFANGALGTVSGSCGIPEGRRFEIDIRLYGSAGELTLDLDRERLVLRRHDGADTMVPVAPGQWTYSCEGPTTALVELAQGRGRNLSPGETGARTVEAIHAITAAAVGGGEAEIDLSLG